MRTDRCGSTLQPVGVVGGTVGRRRRSRRPDDGSEGAFLFDGGREGENPMRRVTVGHGHGWTGGDDCRDRNRLETIPVNP